VVSLQALFKVSDKAIAAAPRAAEDYVWLTAVEVAHSEQKKAEADLQQASILQHQSTLAYLLFGKFRLAGKK